MNHCESVARGAVSQVVSSGVLESVVGWFRPGATCLWWAGHHLVRDCSYNMKTKYRTWTFFTLFQHVLSSKSVFLYALIAHPSLVFSTLVRVTVSSPVHNWCLAPDHVCVDTLETGVRATGHHQCWVSSGNKQCQVVTIIIIRLQTWRRSHCSILCSQTIVITVICRVNTNHRHQPSPDTLLSIELTLRTTVEMVRPHSFGEGWPGVTVPNIFMTVCIFSPHQWRVKRPISILAVCKVMAANICNHGPAQCSVARGWYIANIFWRISCSLLANLWAQIF